MKTPFGISLGCSVAVLMSLMAGSAIAEMDESASATISLSEAATLQLVPLMDQTLTESGTVTVQPGDAGSPQGALSEALPGHCLMSVQVTLGGEQIGLEAGKMVCVTDDRRILELIPEATIAGLGECQPSGGAACGRFVISVDQPGTLSMQSAGRLAPQPRNDQN
ncbi:hypothetical protein [Saccharospirillum impatiens]|uniref:hypothetical protein n=1 Tax=Saccharospirillum impatiens TaxID=169438 RepID=UPI00048BB1C7|nr:hypothetical protein [Saccharospirillum impatiens]